MRMNGIQHIDSAGQGHGGLVPGQTGGEDAIEYIDPPEDPVDQIFW